MKILVVDDNRAMRALIIRMLRQFSRHDFQFREAENGRDALAITASYDPDVVVCDLNMDEMDGIEVLKRLRERGSSAQFGLISSEGCVPETRAKARQEGASFVLSKPFEPDALWSALVGDGEWDVRTATKVLERLVSRLLDGRRPTSTRLLPRVPPGMSGAKVSLRDGAQQIDLALCVNAEGQEALSRAMLGLSAEDPLPPATVADCIAELTNMLAGGFKAEVSGEVRIGVPSLVNAAHLPQAAMATQLEFDAVALALVLLAPE